MKIEKDLTNSSALIKIDGRIDSVTSSELKSALDDLPAATAVPKPCLSSRKRQNLSGSPPQDSVSSSPTTRR